MYAKYNYSSAATLADIIHDVVMLLTGTTDKATLSAGCDQTNTFILTTYDVAGWTLHDSTCKSIGTTTFSNVGGNLTANKGTSSFLYAGMPVRIEGGVAPTGLVLGTEYFVCTTGLTASACTFSTSYANAIAGTPIAYTDAGSGTRTLWSGAIQTLKAAVADDAAFYKYAQVDGYTAGYLQLNLFETWNATTHAGTNQASAIATGYQQRITIGVAASVAMSVRQSHIALQSIVAAGIGASTNNDWTAIFERSRLSPWDTVANAYPPSVLGAGSAMMYSNQAISGQAPGLSSTPRYKNAAGGDFTTTNALLSTAGIGWISGIQYTGPGSQSQYKKVPDGLGGFYTPLNNFMVASPINSFPGGSISDICDVWTTVAYPNNLDEVSANGKLRILWQNSNLASTYSAFSAFLKG